MQWLQKEMAVLGPSATRNTVAVGIGSVSVGTPTTAPQCWPPAVADPWPSMYGWNQSALTVFMAFVEASGFNDVDLYDGPPPSHHSAAPLRLQSVRLHLLLLLLSSFFFFFPLRKYILLLVGHRVCMVC